MNISQLHAHVMAHLGLRLELDVLDVVESGDTTRHTAQRSRIASTSET